MSFVTEWEIVNHYRHDGSSAPHAPVAEVTPASYFRFKRPIGRILAAILLIPGLPIIGLLVVLVRLTSRGPGIYRQTRVGLNGRTFRMYKIRTMRNDAEAVSGPKWTEENDPRVTRIGYFLRKLHLDEFPQLLNVLWGDMCLIGPRPERPEFTQVLAREIPHYLDRLAVLPGVTGLAQINLPPDTDLDCVRRKLVLDLEYIQHAGLFLDLRMLLCTLLRVMGLQGRSAMRLMRLQRKVVLTSQSLAVGKHMPTDLRTPAAILSATSRPPHGANGSSKNAVSLAADHDSAGHRLKNAP